MKRHKLNDMAIFIEVAKANGFRAAAQKLTLSASSVSEAIHRFENQLGVQLFHRSTRSILLTSAGQHLYQRSVSAINDLEMALNDLADEKDIVAGTLRLTAPHSAGPFFLDDLIGQYLQKYPQVKVEIFYSDHKVDLVDTQIDAAIRSQTLIALDTYASAVGPDLQMAIVATPAYLTQMPPLQTPEDILMHKGICFAFGTANYTANNLVPWEFQGQESIYSVMPEPAIITNDLYALLAYARQGLGLAYTYHKTAQHDIKQGQLVTVLDTYMLTKPPYSINYLSKRFMPTRLRAFIDMAKQEAPYKPTR